MGSSYAWTIKKFTEWLNKSTIDDVYAISQRVVSGAMCSECKTEDGVHFINFEHGDMFMCIPCVVKSRSKPPTVKQSRGLTARFKILARDNFTCVYCGKNPQNDGVRLEVDHVYPKSKGGSDDPSNLVTACWECNQGKKDMVLPNTDPQK